MPKNRLMTPGPTQVPENARLALAREIIHHRTPEARQWLAEALDGLKYVFQTKGDVIVISCSGTGAMEAAVVNTVPAGGKMIVLDAGRFAHRWAEVGEAYGLEVVCLDVPWGEAVNPEDVASLLEQHPDAAIVCGTLQETSTGVAHPIQEIAQVVTPTNALFLVDAISGAGVQEVHVDDWGIDMLVVGSQKALMLPPGLAFLTVSEAAWEKINAHKAKAFYFDLKSYKKKLGDPDTPFTPAHTLVAALNENLKAIKEEGIETIWQRGRTLAAATRAGVQALGLELFAARPADGVTSVKIPEGVDGGALLKDLEKKYGVKVAGGQAHLKGKIFRIAHLGIVDELDIIGTIAALEMVLDAHGYKVELGAGVAAAQRVMTSESAAVATA
ncbi:L-aspartate aminotransferase apoenzyme /phosphoserine aminotransferase apoenzyme [Planctomycetales bacterium 10988]|nr:L-aspartate aminotransferase apoenzyme /phosphoserine aminotransferase apoenzyme [Planctomycetales bacterium 10988]